LGKTLFSTKLADKILPNASKAAAIYIFMFIQSSQLVKSFPSLFLEVLEQINVN
jgi:hypothetical protein